MNDILKIHSDLGAAGWHLQNLPDNAPNGAVGLYRRGDDEYAWLVKVKGGGFALRETDRCDFCGAFTECREYHRQTMPVSGQWCEDCYSRWLAEVTFYPMAFGGMIGTGWGDE